jgi:hypothetical protein
MAKVRERLAVSKHTTHRFHMETFSLMEGQRKTAGVLRIAGTSAEIRR